MPKCIKFNTKTGTKYIPVDEIVSIDSNMKKLSIVVLLKNRLTIEVTYKDEEDVIDVIAQFTGDWDVVHLIRNFDNAYAVYLDKGSSPPLHIASRFNYLGTTASGNVYPLVLIDGEYYIGSNTVNEFKGVYLECELDQFNPIKYAD